MYIGGKSYGDEHPDADNWRAIEKACRNLKATALAIIKANLGCTQEKHERISSTKNRPT